MSSSASNSDEDHPKRKKGIRNPAKYKNDIQKKSRLLGEGYISKNNDCR